MKPKILIHCPILDRNKKSYESILNLDVSGVEADFLFTDYNPHPTDRSNPEWGKNWAYKMNKARSIVIQNGYDYLLNVEHDVVVPTDGLKILLEHAWDNRCACGAYVRRDKPDILCCTGKNKKELKSSDVEGEDEVELYSIPFGFTLIGRKVLEDIRFDTGLDASFARKTEEMGFKKVLVPSVKCGHISGRTVLYPGKESIKKAKKVKTKKTSSGDVQK